MADNERTVSFILKARNDASKALSDAQAQVDSLSKDYDQLRAAVDRYNNAESKGDRLNSLMPARDAQKKLDAIADATARRDALQLALAEQELKLAIEQTTTAQERAIAKAKQLGTTRHILITAYGEESTQVKALDQAIQRLTSTQDRAYASTKRMGTGVQDAMQEIAMNKVGGSAGLRNSAIYNLSYQINDVITGLASGQAPMMILAQQGGQIFQIFQTANMSVGEFAAGLGTLASRALRVVGPLGTLLAIFSPFIAAISRLNSEGALLDQFNKNLTIMADGGEHSARAMTDAAMAMKQFGIGSKQAGDFVAAMAGDGIKDDKMVAVANTAKILADVTGIKLTDAMKQVTGAFTGGYDALRKFDTQANIFTAAQLTQIRLLYEGGHAADAQQMALDILSQKLGSTQSSAVTFTSAWNNLITALNATGVPQAVLDFLATGLDRTFTSDLKAVNRISQQIKDIADPSDVARLKQISDALRIVDEQINDAKAIKDNVALNILITQQNMLLSDQANIKARLANPTPVTTGVSTEQAQAQLKLQDDLTAAIQATALAEASEINAIGFKGRALAVYNEIKAQNITAEKMGIALQANGTHLTNDQINAITHHVSVLYDAKDAQDKLNAAEKTAKALEDQMAGAQGKRAQTIKDMSDAIAVLTARYGANAPAVIAAKDALARFEAQSNSASYSVGALVNKVFQLRDALSAFGAMSFDLDRRLVRAQNAVAQVAAGAPEAAVDAEAYVQGEMDKLRVAGASADQMAAQYESVRARAEAAFAAEKKLSDARSAAYSKHSGGGGGGGVPADRLSGPDRDTMTEVNNLYAQRKLLIDQIAAAQQNGDTSKVEELRSTLTDLNAKTLTSIDSSIAYFQTLSGPAAEAALLKLQKIRAEIAGTEDKLRTQFLPTADDLNQKMAELGGNGFEAFAEALANGENAGKAMFAALRQGIAEFLIDIGKAIIKQALFNAISGGTAGGGVGGQITGLIGKIFHDGGIAGGSAASRMAPASLFAGAQRYHGGGFPGLKPGEVPAILERTEEVITSDDPRHARNGGGRPMSVKIVNVLDPADILDAAVSSENGERVMMNFIGRRSQSVKGAIGG